MMSSNAHNSQTPISAPIIIPDSDSEAERNQPPKKKQRRGTIAGRRRKDAPVASRRVRNGAISPPPASKDGASHRSVSTAITPQSRDTRDSNIEDASHDDENQPEVVTHQPIGTAITSQTRDLQNSASISHVMAPTSSVRSIGISTTSQLETIDNSTFVSPGIGTQPQQSLLDFTGTITASQSEDINGNSNGNRSISHPTENQPDSAVQKSTSTVDAPSDGKPEHWAQQVKAANLVTQRDGNDSVVQLHSRLADLETAHNHLSTEHEDLKTTIKNAKRNTRVGLQREYDQAAQDLECLRSNIKEMHRYEDQIETLKQIGGYDDLVKELTKRQRERKEMSKKQLGYKKNEADAELKEMMKVEDEKNMAAVNKPEASVDGMVQREVIVIDDDDEEQASKTKRTLSEIDEDYDDDD